MEVSRVNVVYFLSRNGRVEHPHLVRVHHHSRSGVRLRDVKRWLAEIRGKDMPDSFAWSYKRRYRSGYVWQDLKDGDLITPISDNEYVLKGSQILHASPSTAAVARQHHFFSFEDKEKTSNAAGDARDQKAEEQKEAGAPPKVSSETVQILPDVDDTTSPKPPPVTIAPDQDFLDASVESTRSKAVFKVDASRERGGKEKVAGDISDKEEKGGGEGGDGTRIVNSSRSDVGDSYSKRATEMLWSILMCRDNCTDHDALRPINWRREKARSSSAGGGTTAAGAGGGASRNDSSSWKERSKSSGMRSKRPAENGVLPATYNPAYIPNCSQCGKAFKPEKLHSHMKSCKGLRGRVKRQHER